MPSDAPGGGEWLPAEPTRLPSGRHGLTKEFVASNHRERLIVACAQEVQERGYGKTTVAHIIKRAAVSRRTFYEYFPSKEACFIATHDLLMEHLEETLETAYGGQAQWADQVRAGLAAVLDFFSKQPGLARLCMVEPLAAGPPVSEHHRDSLNCFAKFLGQGRRSAAPPVELAPGTEEAITAGLAQFVVSEIVAGKTDQLPKQLPDLLESALTPFLGPAAAEQAARS